MRERCELCGARLRAEDSACRECGTPRSEPAPEPTGTSDADGGRISFTDIATPPAMAPEANDSTDSGSAPLTGDSGAAPVHAEPTFDEPKTQVAPAPTGFDEPKTQVAPAPTGYDEPKTQVAPIGQPPTRLPELVESDPFDTQSRSRAPLLIGLAILVAVGVGVVVAMSGGDPETPTEVAAEQPSEQQTQPPPHEVAPDRCEDLKALAGKWNFATEVTGARSAHRLGIRGNYSVEITVDGCAATASMAKTGFTGSVFVGRHIQRSQAPLHAAEGAMSFGFGNRFPLRDERGKGVDQQFFFSTHNDQLVGVWRQRGREWDKKRLSGILVGSRDQESEAQQPALSALPCAARCVMACDGMATTDPSDLAGHASCAEACTATPSLPAVCGGRLPPSAEHRLGVTGPEPTLATLCAAPSCVLDPKVRRGKARHVEAEGAPIREAHLVRFSDPEQSPSTSLRVAFATEAGWFLSSAIAPLPGRTEPRDISNARLTLASLGGGVGPRELVGHFTLAKEASFFACRVETGAPVCIALGNLDSIGDVALLQGATLAIRNGEGRTLVAW